MELKFRDLRADEIECRIGTVKEGKGVSLLLYKDARCDQIILDETVGAMNWQKHYSRDNANCIISIWDEDKKQWIEKEDTGTESKTEAEKGLASDSQKRSGFAWGIGRELYSSPFIWISGASKFDKFYVRDIEIVNKKITKLTICAKDDYGEKTDIVKFRYPKQSQSLVEKPKAKSESITTEQAESIKQILMQTDSDVKAFLRNFKVNSVEEITAADYPRAQNLLQRKLEKIEAERKEKSE